MDCRTATAVKFRTKLGFNQYDSILTKEQSVVTEKMKVFLGKERLLQTYVLDCKVDLYFPKRRLAVEFDELDHIDRTGDNEREEKIKKYLKCEFIRINPDGDDYDKYIELARVKNYTDN